jgi:hypothetical protein
MPDEIDRKLVDKRVVQRYLKKGRLDEKEYDQYMKSLPDLANQAVPVESYLDDDFADEPDEPDEGEVAGGAAAGVEGPEASKGP